MFNPSYQIKKLFAFSLLDLFILRFSKYLGFLILVKLLTAEQIGIFGVVTGYLVIASYFLISPESILLRKPKLNQDELSKIISASLNFWLVKTIVVLAGGWGVFILLNTHHKLLALVFIILLTQRLLDNLIGLVQLLFYTKFNQQL